MSDTNASGGLDLARVRVPVLMVIAVVGTIVSASWFVASQDGAMAARLEINSKDIYTLRIERSQTATMFMDLDARLARMEGQLAIIVLTTTHQPDPNLSLFKDPKAKP